jgi:hypothetical protein
VEGYAGALVKGVDPDPDLSTEKSVVLAGTDAKIKKANKINTKAVAYYTLALKNIRFAMLI